ncbi:probable serine/threonine-protein kinase qkgA [Mytilus trossulus]|uniref:probable serine/threonine-protein kinase qkgA n=1 Tax=Mytilus trossulus TaxID=6551 RepID=UPI003003C182
MAIKDKRPAISYDESMKSETVSMEPKIIKPLDEPLVTPQQSSQSSEQAARDFETMLTAKSKVDVHDKEEYATFFLWYFAGDEEFYRTHQTFLSQDAMYLVVTKLNEADDSNAQALFRLWIDSIHCYSRLEEGNIISDYRTTKSGNLDPPIVIAATWTDAVYAAEAGTVRCVVEGSMRAFSNVAEESTRTGSLTGMILKKDDDVVD